MRLLMIAPEPFFEPRGTPFSELHRIRALTDLGHHVDLVTYPFGQTPAIPGLTVYRSIRPPLIRRVRVGPSWPKVVLDVLLACTAVRLAIARRYDAIHSHEEGAVIGVALGTMLGVPHVYDMHSSLPQQLSNFAFSRSRLLAAFFNRIERIVVRRSRVVIVICQHLEDRVKEIAADARTVLIENAPGADQSAAARDRREIRVQAGVDDAAPVIMYTGTFEAYQGLDLLFGAMRLVIAGLPAARLVLVGGQPGQIADAKRQARATGVADATVFVGERPPEEIPAWLSAADALVSPRSRGTNTPLKIYQYLRAGRPIVATRLLTHTQVLNDDVAVLTEATPEALGRGLLEALGNGARVRSVAERARQLADSKYTYAAYLERTRQVCLQLTGTETAEVAGGLA
jgi:glycosyltransferase involved in cell wall biosynthesis